MSASGTGYHGAKRMTALITGLGLLLAGCGGVATGSKPAPSPAGGQAATSGAAATASSASKASQTVIRIGAPYPLTGGWAQNGQNCVNGMELAAQMINAAGGIKALDGAKIKIIPADTSTDNPSQAESVTEQLITSDHVTALVGSYMSNLTLTASTAAEKNKIPMITQSFVDTLTKRGYKYLFQLPPNASTLGAYAVNGYLAIAKKEGKTVRSAAVVGTNDAATAAQMLGVKNAVLAAKMKVTTYDLYPVGVTDAAPIASAIKRGNPDVVFVGGDLSDVAVVVKAAREDGVTVPMVGPAGGGWLTYGLPKALGPYAQGSFAVSLWPDDMNLPGMAAEASAYDKEFKVPFEPMEAGESFTAVSEIVAAINHAGSAQPQAIAAALHAMTFTSGYAAAMPPGKVHFAANGLNQFATPAMIQWQKGVPRAVYPPSVASAAVIH